MRRHTLAAAGLILVITLFPVDDPTAQELGFVPRRMRPQDLLSWRQDGGKQSIHPLARREESVEQFELVMKRSA